MVTVKSLSFLSKYISYDPAQFIFQKYRFSHVTHSASFPSVLCNALQVKSKLINMVNKTFLPTFQHHCLLFLLYVPDILKYWQFFKKCNAFVPSVRTFLHALPLIFTLVKELLSFQTHFIVSSVEVLSDIPATKRCTFSYMYITLFILIIICEYLSCKKKKNSCQKQLFIYESPVPKPNAWYTEKLQQMFID